MSELEQIKQAVEQVGLPEYVRDVKYKIDEDWSGDPAVYIHVIISDAEAESTSFAPNSVELGWKIFNSVAASGTERWPYVHFRSESEDAELVGGR